MDTLVLLSRAHIGKGLSQIAVAIAAKSGETYVQGSSLHLDSISLQWERKWYESFFADLQRPLCSGL